MGSRPLSFARLQKLLDQHETGRILVIGEYLAQVEAIAEKLGAPLVTGKTPQADREQVYERFRRGELHCIVLSKVGNFAIDLPDADVLIQVHPHLHALVPDAVWTRDGRRLPISYLDRFRHQPGGVRPKSVPGLLPVLQPPPSLCQDHSIEAFLQPVPIPPLFYPLFPPFPLPSPRVCLLHTSGNSLMPSSPKTKSLSGIVVLPVLSLFVWETLGS